MKVNGKTIKIFRISRSWSQQHLADTCDVSLRTIQRVESLGVASPETVMALAQSLDVEQSEFVNLNIDQKSRTLPKSDFALRILLITTLLVGVLCGFILNHWLLS